MLNKVQIIGHLGRDPELRYSQSGAPVATLNIATDESYVDKEGNKVERTEWHRVSVFQRSAENCSQYLSKGSLVYVEGKLQTRKWQDPQGQDRYSTEIKADRVQFLDKRGGGPSRAEGDEAPRRSSGNSYGGGQNGGQGGQRATQGAGQGGQRRSSPPTPTYDEDLGPAFPSEASSMDDMPF